MRSKEEQLNKKEEGSLAFPGEVIASAEKFRPGKGTISINNRKIVSTILGTVHFNYSNNFVWIKPIKQPVFPRKGDIVLGEVISAGNSIANIKIWFLIRNNKSQRRLTFIPLEKPFSANLHISQVGMRTELLSKVIKIGDIILGKVVTDYTLPVNIVTNDKVLGVVSAICSICGFPLIKKKELYCPRCNRTEIRKVSALYDYEKFTYLMKIHKPKRYLVMEFE